MSETKQGTEAARALGCYEVTQCGRVYSRSLWRGLRLREMAQAPNASGYPSVRLTIDGKRTHLPVHRIVAELFLGETPSPQHEVRHLDGDPLNNHVTNLAWGTRQDNANDRERHGRTSRGRKHSRAVMAGLRAAIAAARGEVEP